MRETAIRLYEAAFERKKVKGQTALANFLGVSPQVVKNWEARGVSSKGMILAEKRIGCPAEWVKSGVLSGTGAALSGCLKYTRLR